MLATEVQQQARMLVEAHGDKAVAEAAQKAKTLEDSGAIEEAKVWRKIESAIRQMRGPHST